MSTSSKANPTSDNELHKKYLLETCNAQINSYKLNIKMLNEGIKSIEKIKKTIPKLKN